jgi:hypothetical protein
LAEARAPQAKFASLFPEWQGGEPLLATADDRPLLLRDLFLSGKEAYLFLPEGTCGGWVSGLLNYLLDRHVPALTG